MICRLGNEGGGGGVLSAFDRSIVFSSMQQITLPLDHPPPQALSEQLHSEHQRRCKAEVALKRLVDHTQRLQAEVGEERRKQELMVAKVAQLSSELAAEREAHQLMKKEVEHLQVQ